MTLSEAIEKVTVLKSWMKAIDEKDKRVQALEIVLEAATVHNRKEE